MRIQWTDPATSPYTPGSLYVGEDPATQTAVGCKTEKHALTIASARSGKGVGTIIQNLLRWEESALVIDPKGEAAEATAEARDRMGQAVYVLDPYGEAQIPDRFKARFNPLDAIDLNDISARQDIEVLADGIIMRHNEGDGHWDGGGQTIVAGMLAFIMETAPPDMRNLPAIRTLLRTPPDEFGDLLTDMMEFGETCGGLSKDAAAKLSTPKEGDHFKSTANSNTEWLSDPAINAIMQDSTFRMSELKERPTTVYLVVPPRLLKALSRFLRLFVLTAINAMGKGRPGQGQRCLFLLDEFFSFGYLDKVAATSGLMPGYGVHLWPILQDYGQLEKLYDRNGAQTFLENADLLQFFAVSGKTAEFVTDQLGKISVHEVDQPPEVETAWEALWGAFSSINTKSSPQHRLTEERRQKRYQEDMNAYQHQAREVGAPRISPDEVRDITAKRDGVVADGQIAFIKGKPFYLDVKPFFEDENIPAPIVTPTAVSPEPSRKFSWESRRKDIQEERFTGNYADSYEYADWLNNRNQKLIDLHKEKLEAEKYDVTPAKAALFQAAQDRAKISGETVPTDQDAFIKEYVDNRPDHDPVKTRILATELRKKWGV